MRRRHVIGGAAAAVALGCLAAAGFALSPSSHATALRKGRLPTVPVVRTDLSDTRQIDGTLGYDQPFSVPGDSGTLTSLPVPGQVIRRGQPVFGVDGHAVPLFYGSTPLWRSLSEGVDDGTDVKELQRNLAALGYGDGLTADGHFGADTRDAVEHWQSDLGVTQNGTVTPHDVVMAGGPIRVASVAGVKGGPAHGTVLTATTTRRIVSVAVPVSEQQVAIKDAAVRVELPDGSTTGGHVADIGTAAQAPQGQPSAQQSPGQQTQNASITVTVTLDRPSAAGRLDSAPVTVDFTGIVHRGVLVVPVTALLATGPGAYALSVADPQGRTHHLPVSVGMFAAGKVEVSGPGLTEGQRVEVPAS